MKLLYCTKCSDVFSLTKKEKVCTCGETKGKYLDDLHAEYEGAGVPLGFSNFSFAQALADQPEKGWGKDFVAFVIEKDCKTFKKIK